MESWRDLPVDVLARVFLVNNKAISPLLVCRRWSHLDIFSRLAQRGVLVDPLVPQKPAPEGTQQMSLKAAKQLYSPSAWGVLTMQEKQQVLSRPAPPGVTISKHEYRIEQKRHVTMNIDIPELKSALLAIKDAFAPHIEVWARASGLEEQLLYGVPREHHPRARNKPAAL